MNPATASHTASLSTLGDGRAALLAAARSLLGEHGGSRFSLAAVATRARRNSALVSYHFGGKEQMLLAILQEDHEVVMAPLRDLGRADLPAADKLERHIAGLVELHARRPYLTALTHELLRRSDTATSEAIAAQILTPVIDFQRGLLAQGVAEGAFRPVDPFSFYLLLIGGIDMLFAARATIEFGFGERCDNPDLRARFVRQTLAIVLDGIAVARPATVR